MMEVDYLVNIFKKIKLLPFANLAMKTCNKDISKIITASSLKFGQ